MIFAWIQNDCFRNFEIIVGILHDLGIATRKQLHIISKFTLPTLDKAIRELSRRELIQIDTLPDHRSIYRLSRLGSQYAQGLTGNYNLKLAPEFQVSHFLGLNDILVRLIENFGLNYYWDTTKEATDYLYYLRLMHAGLNESDVQKTFIKPDAYLEFCENSFWVEYDNSTESSTQLLKKYRLYITNLNSRMVGYQNVIWITKDKKRKEFLKLLWKDLDVNVIKMYFFVAGEEIQFLRRILDKKSANNENHNELSKMIELS